MSTPWGRTVVVGPSDNPFQGFNPNPDSFQSSASPSAGSECTLSPAASAFSAILSAFVGSVINGLTSGWLVAFMTGWISWLAVFRVLMSAVYMLYRSITNSWGPGRDEDKSAAAQSDASGHLMAQYNNNNDNNNNNNNIINNSSSRNNNNGSYSGYAGGWEAPPQIPQWKSRLPQHGFLTNLWPPAAVVRGLGQDSARKSAIARTFTDLNRDVTVLGWLSWVYTAVYAPTSQIIWVAANMDRHNVGAAKLVKGLTVAITALPLCIDCRVRYADKLKWGGYIFNLVTSLSCLLQGVLCTLLLVTGVMDVTRGFFGPLLIIVAIYPVFSLIFSLLSFVILPIRDGGRKRAAQAHWIGYFIDVGIGAFSGIFLAAPAIMLYMQAQFSRDVTGRHGTGMSDLQAYLACETKGWKWLAAVAP